MSATTTEPTVAEPAVAPAYVMPQPHRGQTVVFYPNGVVGPANGTIGYVTLVGRSNIELLSHGLLKETVCHVSDPLVKENPFVRKCGVWDFSGHDIAVLARLSALEAKFAATEAAKPKP